MKPFEMTIEELNEKQSFLSCQVKGYLDAHTVIQFEESLNQAVDQSQVKQLVVDLGDLYYISSAGIGALMGLTQKLRRQNGELILLRPSEKVFNIFEMLGFTHIFRIVQTQDEAMDALNESTVE
ncbi:STAS domain-containing protein [Candidatus Sumerlaeota bacterium]|nr:STAS domain-containing protein [Candidatus Sumerlaeota bacterium]